jgi:hypothetical protein
MSIRPRVVTILWVLTVAFCVSLVFDLVPLLRGDMPWYDATYDWAWNYGPPRWSSLIPCILGLAIYVLGATQLLTAEHDSRYPVRLILWAFMGAALIPLVLMTLEGQPLFLLFTRTASRLTGGYLDASTLITDLNTTLRRWPQFMAEYRDKVPVGGLALSPPGLEVMYYAANRFFSASPALAHTFGSLVRPLECQNGEMMAWTDPEMASAWFQMFMPLWAALAIAPLYRLGTMIFNREVARWAIALWPLIPTVTLFSPRFNTLYPLMAVMMLVLLWRGMDRRSLWLILLAGFVVSVGTFFNLTLVPLGLLGGLMIVGHWILVRSPIRRLALNLIAFGVGSASTWAIYGLLSGISPFEIVRLGMEFNAQIQRPYLPWLIMHPYDMFLFVGLPLAIFCVWRILRARNLANRADVFALASGLALMILVLSGTARGETGRVWSFFAPLWVLLASDMLQRIQQFRGRTAMLWIQAITMLCMAAVLHVSFTGLSIPPTAENAEHAATHAVDAQFVRGSDALTLVGFDADQSAEGITLHLHWRADNYIGSPYYLSLVPVLPDGSYRQGMTWNPQNWNYPPACWLPGQEFVDDVPIALGEKAPAGDWWFSIAVNDFRTKAPMYVPKQNALQVGIGPVQVVAH